MARAQKEPLRVVAAAERETLLRTAGATSGRVDRVQRARALLAVAAGAGLSAAARQGGFRSPSTVAGLVHRFNQRGLAALTIGPGRGRKARYDPAARAQIVATAQRAPDRKTDGTATWSLLMLQRTLRREGLATVGATTIRRVLHDAGSS